MSNTPPVLVDVSAVNFSYGTDPVLTDVSFQIASGEFVALAGPNGSGKTTLLRVILGQLEPSSGSAGLFGNAGFARHRLGYVPQRPQVPAGLPATVAEVVATGRLSHPGWWRRLRAEDLEEVHHALEIVDLVDRRNDQVSRLSGGQQQRVFIARALASRPELLILDEPTAGVDSAAQARFRDALSHHVHEHDGAVLLVSHDLGAVASELDRVIVLKNTVRFDGPPDVLTSRGVSLGVHSDDLPAWLEELR